MTCLFPDNRENSLTYPRFLWHSLTFRISGNREVGICNCRRWRRREASSEVDKTFSFKTARYLAYYQLLLSTAERVMFTLLFVWMKITATAEDGVLISFFRTDRLCAKDKSVGFSEPSARQIWVLILNVLFARMVWRKTTKFGKITHLERAEKLFRGVDCRADLMTSCCLRMRSNKCSSSI